MKKCTRVVLNVAKKQHFMRNHTVYILAPLLNMYSKSLWSLSLGLGPPVGALLDNIILCGGTLVP